MGKKKKQAPKLDDPIVLTEKEIDSWKKFGATLFPEWFKNSYLEPKPKGDLLTIAEDGVVTSPYAEFKNIYRYRFYGSTQLRLDLVKVTADCPWPGEDANYIHKWISDLKASLGGGKYKAKVTMRNLATPKWKVVIKSDLVDVQITKAPSEFATPREWINHVQDQVDNALNDLSKVEVGKYMTRLEQIKPTELEILVLKTIALIGDSAKTRTTQFIQGMSVEGTNVKAPWGSSLKAVDIKDVETALNRLTTLGVLQARASKNTLTRYGDPYGIYMVPKKLTPWARDRAREALVGLKTPEGHMGKDSWADIAEKVKKGELIDFMLSYKSLVRRARHGISKEDRKVLEQAKKSSSRRHIKNLVRDLIDYGEYPDLTDG